MSASDTWQLPEFTRKDFAPAKSRYAVVIPVLNEGARICRQLERMLELAQLYDIFIVDGGSSDGALEEKRLKRFHVRSLMIKTGPGKLSAQLRIGLAAALTDGYEGVILIDGNNKDNPEAVPSFAQALDRGFDHIQGSRFIAGGKAENTPLPRLLAIRLLHAPLISLAAGVRYTDTTNGFRAYSKKFLTDSRVQPFRNVFDKYELHYYLAIRAGQLGFRTCEVPVERVYPRNEKTPTKIKGFRGNFAVLMTLFSACANKFAPRSET